MSKKSSVPQATKFVSQVLKRHSIDILGAENGLIVEGKIIFDRKIPQFSSDDVVLRHVVVPLHRPDMAERGAILHRDLSEILAAINFLAGAGLLNHRLWRAYLRLVREVQRCSREDLLNWLVEVGLAHFSEDSFVVEKLNAIIIGSTSTITPSLFYGAFQPLA
jgi:hypothetical protein